MNNGNSAWYKSINKSPLTPPGWVISSVWAILYALIAISGVIFLKNGGSVYSAGTLILSALKLGVGGVD